MKKVAFLILGLVMVLSGLGVPIPVYATTGNSYTLSNSSYEYNGRAYVTNVGGTIYYNATANATVSYSFNWSMSGTNDIDCGLYNETLGGTSYYLTIWYEHGQKINLG